MKSRPVVLPLMVVGILVLSGCSKTSSPVTESPESRHSYAPSTVDQLMDDCLLSSPVAACVCLIEAYRGQLSEDEVMLNPGARLAVKTQAAAQCKLALNASPTVSNEPAAVAAERPSRAQESSKAVSADSPEACLQDKLLAAGPGVSVPIEAFERFQRECGL
jgi:hypothetical protein